jgi:hydroxymethylpyrimidine/phosphomethylpyrimidine kinase
MRAALTIAGSDSSGGAGIQADLKTFAALGIYGTSAIAAVTAQSTAGVAGSMSLPADVVTAQIEAVAGDIAIHATKTGMLGTAAIVEAVAAAIEALDLPMVVVDPVMLASGGERLLDEDGLKALRTELLPRARVVTPNIPEAEVLSGLTIRTLDDMRRAARSIHGIARSAVIVKGGHRGVDDELTDVLFDGEELHEFRIARVGAGGVHGTGCTFASAIAAQLALGQTLSEAVQAAQTYVAGAIRHRLRPGNGRDVLDHFWLARADVRAPPPL